MLGLGISSSSILGPSVKKAGATSATIISLEFDDGLISQLDALPILENHGMKGTFYANSGRLGLSGYMTKDQLLDIQSKGNEVGGHTINHLDLTALSTTDAKNQVINDRNALQAMGINASNFAYPFGSYTSTVEGIVKEAGYTSGRTVGGVGCSGCGLAETIPPKDIYATKTPESIKSTTSLATMQSYVTRAEQSGGGWVQMVMHQVDNSGETYSVRPDTLNSFLDWLQSRNSLGTTVKTVGEVVGSSEPIDPPVIPPPPVPTTNMLANPSLEVDADVNSIPDSWELTGWGKNNYKNTRTSDAHSGSWAEKIEILTVKRGDRKIVSTQKDLNLAPNVVSGKTYNISAWYKSNTPVRFVIYYRNTSGQWFWFAESNNIAASSNWTQATWTTPALPSDAVKASAGFMIKNVGWVTVDDLALLPN